MTRWYVFKSRPGRYLNSPLIWRLAAVVEARNELEAFRRADGILGPAATCRVKLRIADGKPGHVRLLPDCVTGGLRIWEE